MPTVITLGHKARLVEAIDRRGLDPFFVVDRDVPALRGRRVRRVSNLENVQEVLRAVSASDLDNVVAVTTAHEQGVFSAAVLRDQLGLPGLRDHARAAAFRDKHRQKKELGPRIPRARCRYVTSHTGFAGLVRDIGLPFVLKPAAGFGSIRTSVIENEEEYAKALHADGGSWLLGALAVASSDVAFVAESFVTGREVHVDGVWAKGALQWAALGRYRKPLVRLTTGSIMVDYVASPGESADSLRRAVELAERSLGELGTPDCVFHLEAFEDEGRMTFGECAVRPSGCEYPDMLDLTFGVDLFEAELAISLGESPVVNAREPELLHGFLHLRQDSANPLRREDLQERFSFVQLAYPARGDDSWAPGRIGLAVVSDAREDGLAEKLEAIARFNEEAVPWRPLAG